MPALRLRVQFADQRKVALQFDGQRFDRCGGISYSGYPNDPEKLKLQLTVHPVLQVRRPQRDVVHLVAFVLCFDPKAIVVTLTQLIS